MTTDQTIESITQSFNLILSQTTAKLMMFNAGCSHGAISMAFDIGIIDASTYASLNDGVREHMKMWHTEHDIAREVV